MKYRRVTMAMGLSLSLPPRGAWIEIKYSENCFMLIPEVAPPTGSVD